MRRFPWLIAITLTVALSVTPVFAQDEGDSSGGFGVDPDNGDDSFTSEAFDNPASGRRVDPLLDLRNWLAKANAPPLDKKQEKPLNKLYEKEVKAMAKSFEKRFGVSLESALAAQTPTRGRRGMARPTAEQTAEVRRLSEQLVNKIIAALRLDQQGALRKYQSEELRTKRMNQLTQSLTLAGFALTPEQEADIEALYARESRLRTLIIVEAKGESHQVRVSRLEAQTTQRVVSLLNQTQKTALAEVAARSKRPAPLSRKEGESTP